MLKDFNKQKQTSNYQMNKIESCYTPDMKDRSIYLDP